MWNYYFIYFSFKLYRKRYCKQKYNNDSFYIFLYCYLYWLKTILCTAFSYYLMFFNFNLKNLLLTFLIGNIYQWWTLLTCLSGNVLISPSFFKNSFARHRILDWQGCFFPPFQPFNSHSSAFWSQWFLMRNWLLVLLRILCIWQVIPFPWCFQESFFAFHQLDCKVFLCGSLCIYPT